MANQILVLIFPMVLLAQTKAAAPLYTVDEVQLLLDNLNQTVLGNILVAHVEIEDLTLETLSFRENAQLTGELGIQEADQRYQAQLTQIKVLSAQDRLNITPCLTGREEKLIELPDLYLDQLSQDLASTDAEAEQLKLDSIYRVDVIINNVYGLEFQLGLCASDDSDCLSDVVDQIEKQTLQLPLVVQSEMNKITDDTDILKAKIQNYSDTNVAKFAADAVGIINEIAHCINSW